VPEIRLDFGKHAGKRVSEVPTDYLLWCLDNLRKLWVGYRLAMVAELARRGVHYDYEQADADDDQADDRHPRGNSHDDGASAGVPATVLAKVELWRKEMALRYHPDRGGSTEVMQALNNAYERLRQLLAAP
jgi:hypothetical protein